MIRSDQIVTTGTVNCPKARWFASMFVSGCLKVDGEGGNKKLAGGSWIVKSGWWMVHGVGE